ncbi:KTSC domain-containing protein [Variovorax sp. NFACC27]|uniref:KTSC domain-containing protein n=1 Tax=unclassified Variovorax TaxID=663243 RepID=UPI00089CC31C|nr:KTSC domain-containing protein [Variovorax sp. NFACC28]SEG77827.1 KTSC domain-containing protein [Variovorax sp. NFACC29]SFC96747.1 KTSC domain-containing protein [Variovorax sp. NFACC26]SFG09699.1 KTSC domain-containing protein [Variovorax sp. NFACC27]
MSKTHTPAEDGAELIVIAMKPVQSQQIASIGYDADSRTLAATFTRGPGTVYQYPNVDAKVFADLMTADSLGSYFGKHIRPLACKKFAPPAAD